MVYAALLATALLATTALARPTLEDRVRRRGASTRVSRPRNTLEKAEVSDAKEDAPETSTNWTGVVYNSPKVCRFPFFSQLRNSPQVIHFVGHILCRDRQLHRPHP